MNTYRVGMFSRSIALVVIALVWLVSTPSLLQAQGDVLDLEIPTIPPLCDCFAELDDVLRARDQVRHVRDELADTRAELDAKNAEWDVRHGRGVGTDTGNFARGDGIEVRYVDGKIQKFVDGRPSGPPRPSRTLDRLRAEIEALEDRIRDLEVEISIAESGVEAALEALKDCIDRCLTIPELQVPKVNFIGDRIESILDTQALYGFDQSFLRTPDFGGGCGTGDANGFGVVRSNFPGLIAFPDVCLTPPPPPLAIPIPYPNIGMSSETARGSKTVKVSGQDVMLKNDSFFRSSESPETPSAGGTTNRISGKMVFSPFSFDVLFEGKNVVGPDSLELGDATGRTQEFFSPPSGLRYDSPDVSGYFKGNLTFDLGDELSLSADVRYDPSTYQIFGRGYYVSLSDGTSRFLSNSGTLSSADPWGRDVTAKGRQRFWASGSDDAFDWESAWYWVLRDDDVFDWAPRIHSQYGEVSNDPGSLSWPTPSDRIFAESVRSFIRANWGGPEGGQGGSRYGNQFGDVRLDDVPDGLGGFAGDVSGFDWESISPRLGLIYDIFSDGTTLFRRQWSPQLNVVDLFGAQGYGNQLYNPTGGGYDIGDLSGGTGATPPLDLNEGNGFYEVQPNGTTVRITIPTAGYDDQYQRIITVRVRTPSGGSLPGLNLAGPGDVSLPPPLSWWARWARAQQGVGSLFVQMVERLSASLVPPVQAAASHAALTPGTVVRLAEAQPGTGAPMLSVVATGASSGETFSLQTLGTALDVVAPDGLVLEAITPGQLQPISATASGPVTTTPMTGYCVDFSKPQPPEGALYQVAPAAVQDEYRPLVSILKAGRELAEAGLLNPDSEVGAYNTFIQQWALWSRLEDWNLGEFTEAFIDRTRENIENLGGEWVAEMGDALRGAAPNRYDDILTVLLEADSLAASEAVAAAAQ